MMTRGADYRLGQKRRGATSKALTAIAILGIFYTVAMFIEVTSATGKSYRDQMLRDQLQKLENVRETRKSESQNTAPAPTSSPTPQRISNGDIATWILTSKTDGRDKDKGTQHAAHNTMRDSPPVSLTFAPGSLQLSHADTLKYCYANPNFYEKHFQGHRGDGSNVPVVYSDKYKLAYIMLPKSGSSTARYTLQHQFAATETRKPLQHTDFEKGRIMDGIEVITFVRDPLSRFFSQYEEAYIRTAPWVSNGNPYYGKQHPFPYLFDNINSYQEYEDVFCPPATRSNPDNRKECVFKPSAENGTLTSRLERFVREYDGRNPFDVHLTLQVPMLSTEIGVPLHLTQIYNTTDADNAWRQIARKFIGSNSTLAQSGSKGAVIEGRSYPRRLNHKLVSVETQRRICELALLDYCCLNLPLPEVCRGAHYKDERGMKTELLCQGNVVIQPGIFPSKATI